MTQRPTQLMEPFDTAELELPPPDDAPDGEVEPGRPSWEPDGGDFS